jgi:protein-S-isoprenylcysteine O-methyltransferase Ste14
MIIFYTFYIGKLLILNSNSIKTNQAGVGNKNKRIIIVERIMSVATIMTIIAQVCSIIFVNNYIIPILRIVGIILGFISIIFFALATITMKDSWRVGIPEEKTTLIINGIYKWSRNPAFVGFDLLYLSILLIFWNIPLLIISIWAAVMLHLQILQEEGYMYKMFGKEYENYKKHTLRYWGRR